MAALAGVSVSTYNNWETGFSRLSLDGAKRLRERFQVSLDFLYFGAISADLPASLSTAWVART